MINRLKNVFSTIVSKTSMFICVPFIRKRWRNVNKQFNFRRWSFCGRDFQNDENIVKIRLRPKTINRSEPIKGLQFWRNV